MVPPNGVSRAARAGSTWMNWWSSVASANWSIIVWLTTRQGETPTSLPTTVSNSSKVIDFNEESPLRPPSVLEQGETVLHGLTAIDREDGPGDIAASPAAQIQRCAGNVTRRADAAERDMRADPRGLLVAGGGKGRHPAAKRARRQRIDRDPPLGELDRQRLGEMVHRGLGGGVGVGVVGERLTAHHRADVDHPRRVIIVRSLAEQWQQAAGEVKDRGDVDAHHFLPGMVGEGLQRLAPGGAGIVHQDMEDAGAGPNRLDQGRKA